MASTFHDVIETLYKYSYKWTFTCFNTERIINTLSRNGNVHIQYITEYIYTRTQNTNVCVALCMCEEIK